MLQASPPTRLESNGDEVQLRKVANPNPVAGDFESIRYFSPASNKAQLFFLRSMRLV
jgi:hypothetical protein